jgi:hypothetical protein
MCVVVLKPALRKLQLYSRSTLHQLIFLPLDVLELTPKRIFVLNYLVHFND